MANEDFITELRCAEALARDAGKRMQIERRAGVQIDYKGKNDLVTNVDRSVETFLRGELALLFPEDAICGEEYGSEGGAPRRQWFIDPIDGTTNFSQGIPIYCVSIALQVEGETVVGAIYDPSRDELFSARRGGGAHLDGAPLSVSETERARDAIVVTGFPPIREGETFEQIIWRLGHVMRATRGVRRLGSAALDLAYVAAGRMDAFWEFNLNPWDTAAGYLLVEEAGGRISDARGNIYTAHEDSVVASNGHIHDTILEALREAGVE